ncbi:MAG TPA: methylamine utilization protein [Marinobacter sp.]|nr:methylamine utilization protein [Marinobacter sp.]
MKPLITGLLALLSLPSLAETRTLDLTLTSAGGPVAGALVFFDQGPAPTPVHTEIYQKDRQFHPPVLVIPAGSSVEFPNRDTTQHHVYSFSPAKTFELELYTDRPEAPVIFDRPGIVELGCNIHDHMQAFVLVMAHEAYGLTDTAGRVQLSVPADTNNTVTVNIWHPRLPDNTRPEQHTIRVDQPVRVSLELTPEPTADTTLDRLQQKFRDL